MASNLLTQPIVQQNINSVFPMKDNGMQPAIERIVTQITTTDSNGNISVQLREPETVDTAFAMVMSPVTPSTSGSPIMAVVNGVSGNSLVITILNLMSGQPVISSSAYSGTVLGIVAFRYRR